MPPGASTRWCPTPEQLMILEELYRGGIRTPNATQIQQITTHLSLYGKIEGKNVFYWFQNHKARDRQKLRRKLLRQQQQQQQQLHQIESHSSSSTTGVLQQLPLYNQTQFLPQESKSSNQVMMSSYGLETEMPHTMSTSHDWIMRMMNSSPCSNKPPKTLQLFPITSNATKDECSRFSCSNSTTTG